MEQSRNNMKSGEKKKNTFMSAMLTRKLHLSVLTCSHSVCIRFHWKFIDKKKRTQEKKKKKRKRNAKLTFYFCLVRALTSFFISLLRFAVLIMLSCATFNSIGEQNVSTTCTNMCFAVSKSNVKGHESGALFNMHQP